MSARKLADCGEDQLIAILTRGWEGVGDDCAVLDAPRRGEVWLLKTDAVVEGVHFARSTPAALVGRKAMARCLSDIAAAGGTPRAALVTLAAPGEMPLARVRGLYAGLARLARRTGVRLSGGESVRAKHLLISVTVVGTTLRSRVVTRSGGRPGDILCVTGRLGNTRAGHHLRFQPRLEEGRWLAHGRWVTAMMDLSDGLASDLPRLARRSKTGWVLDRAALPLRAGATLNGAECDGEDFELLFSVSPQRIGALVAKWPFRTRLTPIGLLAEPGTREPRFTRHGFDHFANA
jgi:thiamine-monophosphate kinase